MFGPVLTFQTFGDEDAGGRARELDPRTGCRRSSTPGREERAERVGRAVRAGTVWVNTFLVRDLTAPFGGVGHRGIGREGGDYALDFYSDLKTLQILDGHDAMSTRTLDDVYLDNDAFAERVPHETFELLRNESPGALVRLGARQGLLGDHPLRRHRGRAQGLADVLVGDRRDRARGPRPRPDRGPQVDARHRSAASTRSLRAIVNKGFTPRAVAAYEDLLRELTQRILDDALPRGEFDFVEEVAKQLPIQVLCRILGVPLSDDDQLIDWGDKMIGNTDPELGGLHPASPESAKYRLYPFRSPAAMEVFRYGHAIAAERREEPRDDLVSKLVTWEDEDGRRLTEREFDTMFLLLVVAGNETTRQSIAHGMLALMEHPEAMSQLAATTRR